MALAAGLFVSGRQTAANLAPRDGHFVAPPERVHRAGIQVNCHANGDIAIDHVLTAYERASYRARSSSNQTPIRGHTSSVPRHGLRGVGGLKQLPKPVCQQFDGLPQGAELPNPDYRDGSVQIERWGTQYFHGIDRMIPGNKASG